MPNRTDIHKHAAHDLMSREHLYRGLQVTTAERDTAVEPLDLFKAVAKRDIVSGALITRTVMVPLTVSLDKVLGTHGNPYKQLHEGPTFAGAKDDHGTINDEHEFTGLMDIPLMVLASVRPLDYAARGISQVLCLAGASVKGVGTGVGGAIMAPIAVAHAGVAAAKRQQQIKIGTGLLQWVTEAAANNSELADAGRNRAAKFLNLTPLELEALRFLVRPAFTHFENAQILVPVAASKSRAQLVTALGHMNFDGIAAKYTIETIVAMAKMTPADATAFARAVRGFGALDADLRRGYYHDILETPVEGRASHANRLLHGNGIDADIENLNLDLRNNNENVMDPRRRVRVAKAIDYLLGLKLKPMSKDKVIARIDKASKDTKTYPVMLEKRRMNGRRLTREENVKRVLYGTRLVQDYTDPLVTNYQYAYRRIPGVTMTDPDKTIGLVDLVGIVLAAIDSYNSPLGLKKTKEDQHDMMGRLLFWVSEIIEDDGHRVCGVGISQRLPMCLQGYYPIHIDVTEPESLVSEICREWAGEWAEKEAEPDQKELNDFTLRSYIHATDAYTFEPSLIDVFKMHFKGYLTAEFGPEKANAADASAPVATIEMHRKEREDVIRGIKKSLTEASLDAISRRGSTNPEHRKSVVAEASSSAPA